MARIEAALVPGRHRHARLRDTRQAAPTVPASDIAVDGCATLVAHRETLTRLSPAESALYADLRDDRLGTRVRLEQERIAFGHLESALAER